MHACIKSSHCILMSPFLLMSKSRYKEFKSLAQSCACVAWLCLTLCNPMDCSLPGSSVHGISQARILEWVAISCSRRSSQHRDQTRVSCISCIGRQILYQLCHPLAYNWKKMEGNAGHHHFIILAFPTMCPTSQEQHKGID